MRGTLHSLRLETAVPLAAALTIVAFACGSSSISWLNHTGKDLRWVFLFVLVGAAGLLFVQRVAWSRSRPFALAGWLVLLTLVSTAWSVDPRLTFERAGSLALLLAAAFLVATASASLALVERVLAALLGGAVAVALIGVVLVLFDRHAALQQGSTGVPTRFRGLGEDANTAALLFAVVLPVAVWGVARGGRPQRRVAAACALLLLDGSIVASLSRGALFGGFAGAVVVALWAPRTWNLRLAYCGALAVLCGVSFAITTLPKPLSHNVPAATAPAAPTSHPKAGYLDANAVFPLDDDIGRALPHQGEVLQPRRNFGSSGRTEAWRGAAHLAAQRPFAGYGFGSESHVFVDRYHAFAGGLVENSYLGMALQLGLVGLVSFLALFVLWLARGARAYRRLGERDRLALVACCGIVFAGLACALVQSYLTSVGNIATTTFWIGAFLLAVLGDPWGVWPASPPVE